MQRNYKNAMNKITVDDGFEARLKARLAREQVRVENSAPTVKNRRLLKTLTSAAAAAVVLLSVITAAFSVPGIFNKPTADIEMDKPLPDKTQPTVQVSDELNEYASSFRGSNAVCLAQDLSMRIVSEDTAIRYDTNIFFSFEGFDKYNIELTGSCIVFETALAPDYTLANFFSDYYNLIVNDTGVSKINNGLLESFFNINENGANNISVFDGTREIIDLDTALMSEYKDRDNIHFIITIS